jgi:glycosyltransferase involved in cell wall biosynthesis
MKVAVFHDYLNQFGGAERVLQTILEMFPDADLYTLLYDKEKTFGLFHKHIKKTSFLDIPLVRKKHRAFIPLMPFAAGLLKIHGEYDLIISSSAGYAKGFGMYRKKIGAYHICYCHSPLRYAWEIDYLKNLSFFPTSMSKDILRPVARWLQRWDKKASERVNVFIANSHFIAKKIKSYYGREAEVIYPPVDIKKFSYEPKSQEEDFYLMVGRLLYYKGFDLGIQAFNKMKKRLKIIGKGPEEKKLRELANPVYIEFLNSVSDAELKKYYNSALAFIFPQIEDFGLVAAEAQACGTPVLAFCVGGGGEIVQHGRTGLLFKTQTAEDIIESVKDFEVRTFNRAYIAESAQRFSEEEFKKKLFQIVEAAGFRM